MAVVTTASLNLGRRSRKFAIASPAQAIGFASKQSDDQGRVEVDTNEQPCRASQPHAEAPREGPVQVAEAASGSKKRSGQDRDSDYRPRSRRHANTNDSGRGAPNSLKMEELCLLLPHESGALRMRRRSFVSLMGTGPLLLRGEAARAAGMAPKGAEAPSRSGKPVKMHLGTQQGPTTARMFQYLKRHGVNHICGGPPDPGAKGAWTADDLRRTCDLCEQHGVSLDMVALPFLTSSHIDHERTARSCWGKVPNAIATSNRFKR